jgi:hypothetical protein
MNRSIDRPADRPADRAPDPAVSRSRRLWDGVLLRLRRSLPRRHRDAGMSTAEYAVGTIAACGFAAVLYKVVTSGPVSEALQQLVERALNATF